MNSLPLLGISMGDPASIGPEVTVKAIADPCLPSICRPVVIGDASVLRAAIGNTGVELQIQEIQQVSEATFEEARMNVLDLGNVEAKEFRMGEVSALCGEASFEYVTRLIDLAMRGEIHATVTGPINKQSINLAGHCFSGHTEIYAEYTGSRKYAMLLVEEDLRVAHVSTHVSLRRACELVKTDRVLDVIELMDGACKRLGIPHPLIGVAGLNPHAGDGGLFGDEERREIIPAIEAARDRGYRVEGPVPADTLFSKAIGGLYDGCVAMYHDQGHIPFKLQGFRWDKEAGKMRSVRGVNITLGLPIIRTSVDHGTAMEIAGKNIASPDAMKLAIQYAARLYRADSGSKVEF